MPSTEGLVKGFLQQHLNQVTEKRESEPTVRLAPIFFYPDSTMHRLGMLQIV